MSLFGSNAYRPTQSSLGASTHHYLDCHVMGWTTAGTTGWSVPEFWPQGNCEINIWCLDQNWRDIKERFSHSYSLVCEPHLHQKKEDKEEVLFIQGGEIAKTQKLMVLETWDNYAGTTLLVETPSQGKVSSVLTIFPCIDAVLNHQCAQPVHNGIHLLVQSVETPEDSTCKA